jgi:hypothetical protein
VTYGDDYVKRQAIRECLEVVRVIGEGGAENLTTRHEAFKECARLVEIAVNSRFAKLFEDGK